MFKENLDEFDNSKEVISLCNLYLIRKFNFKTNLKKVVQQLIDEYNAATKHDYFTQPQP